MILEALGIMAGLAGVLAASWMVGLLIAWTLERMGGNR